MMKKNLLTLCCLTATMAVQAQPQAAFTAQEAKDVYFSDDFESGLGKWQIDTTYTERPWGTLFNNNYAHINPTSKNRLYCYNYRADSISAEVILTPALSIKTGSAASFYAIPSITNYVCDFIIVPASNPADTITVIDFNAWVKANNYTDDVWTPFSADLSAYAGQQVQLGFRFKGTGIRKENGSFLYEDLSVDDFTLYQQGQADNRATIYIDDAVHFTNLSTGEGNTYQWTFEGGQPATSSEENPVVVYTEAGTYGVTLTVTNASGTDSREVKDFVTVNYKQPVATVILPSTGFYKRTSSNIFVPGTKRPVTFSCTAENHPTYYYWEIMDSKERVVATSNEESITVAFDTIPSGTSNAFYQYRLTVGNPGGEEVIKSGNQAIQVGGSSSIWNVESEWKPNTVQSYYMMNGEKVMGYYGGTNDAGVTKWAERFVAPLDTCYILQTQALFAKVGSYARGSKATLYYAYEDENGLPGEPIEGSEITLNASQLTQGTAISRTGAWQNKWAFDDNYPLLLFPRPFYVVLEGLGTYNSGSYQIALDAVMRPEGDTTTTWMYQNGEWKPTPEPMTLLFSPWLGYSEYKLRPVIDEWKQTTGISTAVHTANGPAAYYDLSGRRLTQAPQQGLYIERTANGQTVKRVAR